MLRMSFLSKGFTHLLHNLSSAGSVKHVKTPHGRDTHLIISALLPLIPQFLLTYWN